MPVPWESVKYVSLFHVKFAVSLQNNALYHNIHSQCNNIDFLVLHRINTHDIQSYCYNIVHLNNYKYIENKKWMKNGGLTLMNKHYHSCPTPSPNWEHYYSVLSHAGNKVHSHNLKPQKITNTHFLQIGHFQHIVHFLHFNPRGEGE